MPEKKDRMDKKYTGLERYNIEREARAKGISDPYALRDDTLTVGEARTELFGQERKHKDVTEEQFEHGGYGMVDDTGAPIKKRNGNGDKKPPAPPPARAPPPADDLGLYQIEYGSYERGPAPETARYTIGGKTPMVTIHEPPKYADRKEVPYAPSSDYEWKSSEVEAPQRLINLREARAREAAEARNVAEATQGIERISFGTRGVTPEEYLGGAAQGIVRYADRRLPDVGEIEDAAKRGDAYLEMAGEKGKLAAIEAQRRAAEAGRQAAGGAGYVAGQVVGSAKTSGKIAARTAGAVYGIGEDIVGAGKTTIPAEQKGQWAGTAPERAGLTEYIAQFGPITGYQKWSEARAGEVVTTKTAYLRDPKTGQVVLDPKTGKPISSQVPMTREERRLERQQQRIAEISQRLSVRQQRVRLASQETALRTQGLIAARQEVALRREQERGMGRGGLLGGGLLGAEGPSPSAGLFESSEGSSTVGLMAGSERGLVGGRSTPQLMGPSGGGLLGPTAWGGGGGLLGAGAAGSGLLGPSYGGNTGLLAPSTPGGGMPGGGLLGGSMMGGGLFGGPAPQQGQFVPAGYRQTGGYPSERPGVRHRRVFSTIILPGGTVTRIPIPEGRLDEAGYKQLVAAAYQQSGQLDAATLAAAANLPVQGPGGAPVRRYPSYEEYAQQSQPQQPLQPQGGLMGGMAGGGLMAPMPSGYGGPLIANPVMGGLMGSTRLPLGGFA